MTSDKEHLDQAADILAGCRRTATGLAATAAALDANVEERALALFKQWSAAATAEFDRQRHEVAAELAAAERRQADLLAEFDRQRRMLLRNYDRSVAALRHCGVSGGFGPPQQVDGEPDCYHPAEQIAFWLDGIMPPWPEGKRLVMSGECLAVGRLEAGTQPEDIPHPTAANRIVPLGALILALKAVLDADPLQLTEDTVTGVRNVLVSQGVPEQSELLRQTDRGLTGQQVNG